MNCQNCGSPVKDGAKFCPVCGAEIVIAPPVVPPVERDVVDAPPTTDNKGLKITLIVLACLLAVGLIVAILLISFNDSDDKPMSTCEKCDKQFEGTGDVCEDCEEQKTVKKGKVLKCECGKELKTDSILCEDCLKKLDKSEFSGECVLCGRNIEKEEIAVIDDYGLAYCVNCSNNKACEECSAPLEKSDEDDICYNCAAYACSECHEVLGTSEGKESLEGYLYCPDCYEKEMVAECRDCKERFAGESLLCGDCLDKADPEYLGSCFWCETSLDWREIAVVDDDGYVYCEDCDTGVYCENCGAPVDKGEEFCGSCTETEETDVDAESETESDADSEAETEKPAGSSDEQSVRVEA